MMNPSFRIRPSIVLFGDSLTQQGFGVDGKIGWSSLLAAAYSRRADVLNRGFSGYNTNHAIELLPRVFTGSIPGDGMLFCTVFFGANDAALPAEPQHVPIEQYKENLRSIVFSIREKTESKDAPIILMTPPPVAEDMWKEFREVEVCDRDNQNTRNYGDKVKEVAKEMKCTVVDTWELLQGDSDERAQYLSDGLHLSESGNRLVFQGVLDHLKTNFPDRAPMDDDDGEGKYGLSGIPVEEKLWKELCGLN